MIATLKKELRREVLKKRDHLSLSDRLELSRQICNNLMSLEEFHQAKVIHFFLTARSEVMTEDMIRMAFSKGKEIVVPFIDKEAGEICLSQLEDLDKDLMVMSHGIREPKPELRNCIPLNHVDIMIVPGVAFDLNGNRLGYGTGYYDKLLQEDRGRPVLIAMAFELQIVDEVPVGDHDVRIDKIITEKRIIEVMTGS